MTDQCIITFTYFCGFSIRLESFKGRYVPPRNSYSHQVSCYSS